MFLVLSLVSSVVLVVLITLVLFKITAVLVPIICPLVPDISTSLVFVITLTDPARGAISFLIWLIISWLTLILSNTKLNFPWLNKSLASAMAFRASCKLADQPEMTSLLGWMIVAVLVAELAMASAVLAKSISTNLIRSANLPAVSSLDTIPSPWSIITPIATTPVASVLPIASLMSLAT